MAVHYDETRKIFSLQTKNSTYQLQIDRFGVLLNLYYGSRTESPMDYLLTYADRGFPATPMTRGRIGPILWMCFPRSIPATGQGISAASVW